MTSRSWTSNLLQSLLSKVTREGMLARLQGGALRLAAKVLKEACEHGVGTSAQRGGHGRLPPSGPWTPDGVGVTCLGEKREVAELG